MEHGIEETKEVVVAVNELALVIIKHLKDGFQVADIPAITFELLKSDEFKLALTKAIGNIAQVPVEVKDIDINEGIELAKVQIGYVPKFIDSLKK